ncbi:mannitol dehydrogenase family protein [Colwellia sp. M166]|uniref:mannitol dehydrogenase family protein n=1 Tax=Colwellia sp. M166 TaxID=2583805 RepID=UPI00211E8842|nr:mannitol dehydrogenase family protein [Colwellia sp. M166]UUO25354.1 mannitol dehydrogenase family protein [Colwellia sp. M166]|tara:strand:- start:60151 stop:61617 length:1467 start_codon:yes stop_codon:yes gene_type:complete
MPIKLNNKALDTLPSKVVKPNYSRESLSPGIIHIGVGNFHRAHQAMYMHKLFNAGIAQDWAIRGAGIKSYDAVMRDKLKQQDWLTTVVELDENNLTAQVTASMIDFIESDAATLITALSESEIRIVSLTITEGGYFMDDKTGAFNLAHPEIQADIANVDSPSTVFGLIIAALKTRRAQNIPPFTVMSCDNIPHNGKVVQRIVNEMANAIDAELARWIDTNVTFPNSMVDCITPATSAQERERLTTLFGIEDLAPVFCEPFRQWVLEDNFVNGRPPLEEVGVEFVEDVAPFELMKLRILNGGHAAIAYPAALLNIVFVHDVMADPLISKYLKKLVSEEIIPTLSPVPGVSFDDYFSIIESRFANPEIRDTVPRLCQDASNRLPKFILPIIAANIKNNKDCKGLALVVALWCRLCFEGGNIASNFTLDDPQSARLITQAKLAKEDASIFLQMNDIFGDLSDDVNFSKNFSLWLEMLWDVGTLATLKHYLK